MMWYKARAFFRRDLIIETSYKMAFLLSLLASVFPIVSFFFIGKLMEGQENPSLDEYGGAYFPFALIGLAFTRFFQLAITTFSNTMRRAQMAGCLEAILSSQTDSRLVVLFSSTYSFVAATFQLIVMFGVGVVLMGFSFANTNVPAMLLSVLLSLIVFVSFGILAAAGTIIFKKGEPFSWFFVTVSGILAGALFPIEVMPEWLQSISLIVPITYSLEALRLSILQGHSIAMLSDQLLILAVIGGVMLPASLQFFKWSVEKGKRNGSLVHY